MLSNKPYLMRAFYDWIVDSQCTPILVLDATNPRCQVPDEFIEGGEIVFNISPVAIRDLRITNQAIEFKASFSGVIHIISAPVRAVMAVYAEENGEGLFFEGDEDEGLDTMEPQDGIVQLRAIEGVENSGQSAMVPPPIDRSGNKSKPFLKLVE